MAHVDATTRANGPGRVPDPLCPPGELNAVLPWADDAAEMRAGLDALRPAGGTAMSAGTRVGALLLDPSLGGIAAAVRGTAPSPVPAALGDGAVRKVLILLVTEANDEEPGLPFADPRRTGPSGAVVYRQVDGRLPTDPPPSGAAVASSLGSDTGTSRIDALVAAFDLDASDPPDGRVDLSDGVRYSFWDADRGKYWVPNDPAGDWRDAPEGGEDAVALTWPELHALVPLQALRYDLLGGGFLPGTHDALADHYALADVGLTRAYGSERLHPVARTRLDLDARLRDVCAALGSVDVAIHAVLLDPARAGPAAADPLRNCAGEDRFHGAETSADLRDALAEIGAAIRDLRLVR
jgi:hypothetical protein